MKKLNRMGMMLTLLVDEGKGGGGQRRFGLELGKKET